MNPLRPWQRLALFGFALACMVGLGVTVATAARQPAVQAAVKGHFPANPGFESLPIVDRSSNERAWPMFGGSLDRNMVNLTEKNLPADVDVESGKNVLWSADLGTQSYGNPVIAGGKVFVGTNNGGARNARDRNGNEPIDKGVVMCFQEADGKFLWQAVHEKLESGRVNDWPEQGVCSSPFVEGKRLFYVSNRCELICADIEGRLDGKQGLDDPKRQDPTDADILWKLDMMKELGVFPHNLAVCSPIVVGDLIFILTGNGHDESHENIPAPKAPSFICVDKNTGKVKWTNNYPGEKVLHGQWSNPCFGVIQGVPQVIFAGGDGWLRAFDPPTGNELWKFDCNPKSAVYKLGGKGTRNYIIGTPVVWEDKVYINTGQDPEHGDGVGHLWCVDPTKAKGKPGADLSPVGDDFDPKSPANRDSGLVWHVGGADDKGELRWRRSLSTAAIKDGLLYICNLPGYICCFDARTGQKHWEHDALTNIWGSCYVADGKVYVCTEEGDLLVFQEGKEKKQLGKFDLKAPALSTPVACNGVLYVMTKNKLYALKNK